MKKRKGAFLNTKKAGDREGISQRSGQKENPKRREKYNLFSLIEGTNTSVGDLTGSLKCALRERTSLFNTRDLRRG